MRPVRAPEKVAEKAFVDWARNDQGALTRKMNGLGFRHWPDQLVVKPKARRVLWLEFKREGEDIEPAQKFLFDWLRRLGQRVVVVWSLAEAQRAYLTHR